MFSTDIPPPSVTLTLVNITQSHITLLCTVTTIPRLLLTDTSTLLLTFDDSVLSSSLNTANEFVLNIADISSGVYVCISSLEIQGLNITVNGSDVYNLTLPG